MKTVHQIYFENSGNMSPLPSESADLVVTSPPYPMIEMWDEMFVRGNPLIREGLEQGRCRFTFEQMHQQLDPVWKEVYRVLKPGGMACINIGDATRTLDGHFMLYPNHARISERMLGLGFTPLPAVLWRKQTNAPNKFMGSGMLPAGAYVTLEHEYILIFRKGEKRAFKKAAEKQNRRESAIFWEERNIWFSDIWTDLKGTRQKMTDKKVRSRNGAYPFEVPYRLINMFSARGDTVLDPFLGTGTTTLAAMASGRNSLGFEVEEEFREIIFSQANHIIPQANERIRARLAGHRDFIKEREQAKGPLKYENKVYGFPVMTRQETELYFNPLKAIAEGGEDRFEVVYSDDVAEVAD